MEQQKPFVAVLRRRRSFIAVLVDREARLVTFRNCPLAGYGQTIGPYQPATLLVAPWTAWIHQSLQEARNVWPEVDEYGTLAAQCVPSGWRSVTVTELELDRANHPLANREISSHELS